MFLLNLTLGQLLLVAGSLAALTTVLYLIDRSRKRLQVSTLRFWSDAEKPVASQRRRKIQQPVSLLLQLLALLLLLLAMAQPRLGSRDALPAQHVLLLDTSSWMEARSPASADRTLMDDARDRAVAYVNALPASDEVMLVHADALASPATAFVASRQQLMQAIADAHPEATALRLRPVLAFAQKVQQLGGRPGEVVYVGPARIHGTADDFVPPANLRVIPVSDRANNAGLVRVSLKRSEATPEVWDIFVVVRNYSSMPRTVSLVLGFDGAPIGGKQLTLAPGSEQQAVFAQRSSARGVLDVRLLEPDDFAGDNRAEIEAPALASSAITVYTNQPEALRPLFASSRVSTTFRSPAQYQGSDKGLVVLDRFAPPAAPNADTVWIDPPRGASPVAVHGAIAKASALTWSTTHSLAAGLRAHDLRLDSGTVFTPSAGDEVVASVDAGPVIVTRSSPHRMVVIGFEPSATALRYDLSTPLFFANVLRWALPGSFGSTEIDAQPPGTVTQELDSSLTPQAIRVTSEDGTAIPFSIRDRSLNFFAGCARQDSRARRRSRKPLLAHTAGDVGRAMDAARQCSHRHSAQRRRRIAQPLARCMASSCGAWNTLFRD